MLRKLFRYEFAASARSFLLAYAALLVLSALFPVSLRVLSGSDGIAAFLATSALVLLYIAVVTIIGVLTLAQIIGRFNSNLLGSQGYLMHTLPVTPVQHILAKLLAALAQGVLSVIAGGASLVILSFCFGGSEFFTEAWEALMYYAHCVIGEFNAAYDMPFAVYAVMLVLLVVTEAIVLILSIYASLSMGQLINRHRILLSVGVFIGFRIVMSIITDLLSSAFGLVESSLGSVFVPIVSILVGFDFNAVRWVLLSLAEQLIFAGVFFLLTSFLLKKHLNLE